MQRSNLELLSIPSRPAAPLFPGLEEQERQILSQIINLTPPNTNAFNVLLSPYETTLRRHRIDPKIDDKYYTFLLKLSLAPGSDWKQKWATVQSTQSSSSTLVSQQAAIPANQAHLPTHHDSRRTKQQADINSQENEMRETLIKNPKPINNHKTSDWSSRPHKSVHFLPSRAEEKARRTMEPQPEKDLSLPIELQSEIIPSKMTLLVDPIDVKARRFRRQQLLARVVNKWTNSIIYWNTLNSEAQCARRILDISAVYQTWTRKFRHQERKLQSTDATYNTRLLFSHLDHWRKLTLSKTIQKKSLALRYAYRKTKGTRDRNQCRQVLIIWANHMKSSNFYDFSTRQLIPRSLHHWYQKLQYLSRLSLASNNLLSRFNSTQRHRILSQWYHETVLRSKLKDFLDDRNIQLKQQTYLHWKITVIQSRRSNLFFRKSCFHRLLKACKEFRARQRRLELSEITVMAFRSSNTQLHVFRHWIICGRGLLFSKFIRTRLLRLRVQQWRRRTAHVHYHLPHLQNQFTVESTLYFAGHHLQHWIQYHHHITQNYARAQQFHRVLVIHHLFSAWRSRHQRLQLLEFRAASIRIKFLRKRVLLVWKRRVHKIKVNLWRQRQRLGRVQGYFSAWQLLAQKQRQLSTSLSAFLDTSSQRHCSHALYRWRVRVSLGIRNEQIAATWAQKNMKRWCWEIWTDRHQSITLFNQESSMVIHRRNQAEKTNLLAYWLTRTRAQLAQNSLLAHFSDRHRRSVIYSVWERWTDRTRARQLEPLVQILNSILDKNYKNDIIRRWIARSSILFLRQEAQRKMKIDCWKHWCNSWKSNQLRGRFLANSHRRLVHCYFSIWCKKCLDLKTLKMISRFKNNLRIAQPPARRFGGREVPQDDYATSTSLTTSSSNETSSS